MSNGRDDNTVINYTVADRVLLAEMNRKLDSVANDISGLKEQMSVIVKQTTKNTAWIKIHQWIISAIFVTVALRVFGVF